MVVNSWAAVFSRSFQDLWYAVITFLPNIIFAILIFIIGWLVGSILGSIISQLVKALKVDHMLKNVGLEELLARSGFRLNMGRFLGELVKWFIVSVFLLASLEWLHLSEVTVFLETVVLLYIPRVIAAVLILLFAAFIGEVAKGFVAGTARAAGSHSVNLLSSITKWAIWILAVLTALQQLGIAPSLIQTFFTGVTIAASLAFGLSFGLGGQKAAADYIEKIRGEIAHGR
jgi:small-conductance mechanosensitive channel